MKHRWSLPAFVAIAALPAAGGSCRVGQPDPTPRTQGCSPQAASASAARSPVSSAQASPSNTPPSLPYSFTNDCAHAVDAHQPANLRLEQIGAACAAGMHKTLALPERNAPADAWMQLPLELPMHACVRLAVVATPGTAVLQARLVDPSGRLLATRPSTRQPLLVGAQGPVCVGAAGRYTLHLRALGASAVVSTVVWAALPPSPSGSSSGS